MKTPTSNKVGSAIARGRAAAKRLLSRRRPQLLFAVLFGALIGGGLTVVASVGLPHHQHHGGPGISESGQSGYPPGDFGGGFGPGGDHR